MAGQQRKMPSWHFFPPSLSFAAFYMDLLLIRDRCRKEHDLHERVWDVYRAETAEKFKAGMGELLKWMNKRSWPNAVRQAVEKLAKREPEYAKSYAHPQCLRTSNMVDRLMNRLTRYLYDGLRLHGHQWSSELRLRGWALLRNFTPYAPRSNQKRIYSSPAHSINQKVYHNHWLHNLNISASLAGFRNSCT